MSLNEVVADAPLAGRVALVTGAAHAVGRACAVALANAGCIVAACDREAGEPGEDGIRPLDATTELCARASGQAAAFEADVTDALAVERLWVDVTAALGAPVVLVSAPGRELAKPMGELTPEEWQQIVTAQLDAAFYGARAVLPAMRAAGFGRILNVALAPAGMALVSFTRKWAVEESPRGITVNAVVAGALDTGDGADDRTDPRVQAPALGRLARPDEVARVVAFLASPASGAITGARVDVGTPWSWSE